VGRGGVLCRSLTRAQEVAAGGRIGSGVEGEELQVPGWFGFHLNLKIPFGGVMVLALAGPAITRPQGSSVPARGIYAESAFCVAAPCVESSPSHTDAQVCTYL